MNVKLTIRTIINNILLPSHHPLTVSSWWWLVVASIVYALVGHPLQRRLQRWMTTHSPPSPTQQREPWRPSFHSPLLGLILKNIHNNDGGIGVAAIVWETNERRHWPHLPPSTTTTMTTPGREVAGSRTLQQRQWLGCTGDLDQPRPKLGHRGHV
jgi:hypothetical protein